MVIVSRRPAVLSEIVLSLANGTDVAAGLSRLAALLVDQLAASAVIIARSVSDGARPLAASPSEFLRLDRLEADLSKGTLSVIPVQRHNRLTGEIYVLGASTDVLIQHKPLLDTAAGIVALVLDNQDLVERAERSADLVEYLEAERQMLADLLPVGVIVVDPLGSNTLVNRAARELTQSAPDQPAALPPDAMALRDPETGQFLQVAENPLLRALTGQKVHGRQVALRGAGNEVIQLTASAAPILNRDGRVIGAGITLSNRSPEQDLRSILFEAVPVGVVVQTASGATAAFNRAACRVLGLPAGPAEPFPPLSSFGWSTSAAASPTAEADMPWHIARTSRAACGPVAFNVRGADGQQRWLELTSVPLFTTSGTLSHVVTTLVDIGQQAKVEEALQFSERRFRTVVESLGEGILITDLNDVVIYLNRRLEELTGYSFREMAGNTSAELLSRPEDRQKARERSRRRLQGVPEEFRDWVNRKDGTGFWAQVIATPLRDGEGHIAGSVSALTDVTERTFANEALRESEHRFRTIFEQAGIGICLLDTAGQFLSGNPRAAGILGRDEPELQRLNLLDLAQPPENESLRLQLDQLVSGALENISTDIRVVRVDGSVAWANVTMTLVRGANGGIQFVLLMLEDITERKEAEARVQAMMRAEKLRDLGQMASGVAHDINQYLSLVVGHGEMALNQLAQPAPALEPIRESLTTIVQAALDGRDAVLRLQAFSRARPDSPREPIDLGRLLSEVAKLTAPRWRDLPQQEGRPIRLFVESEGDTTILGWPENLREALTNLVFNAVDALPSGGEIHLAAERKGGQVRLRVADNGVGIPPEILDRIYEPFFTTKGDRGSGLGLSIVYTAVERHQGQIAISPGLGQGTTFTITLPAASEQDAVVSPQESAAAVEHLRVLAVDDDPALGVMLAHMLQSEGHQVIVATSGEEALRALEQEQFDLVISDLGMGQGMNGWELASQVRRQFPALHFALATGWGAEIDPEEAKRRGVDAVIAKPYRIVDLRKLILSAFS